MIGADAQEPNFEELAIPASEIIDVLDTRPSVLRRHVSVAYTQSPFHGRRDDRRFSSLQYAKGGTLRRDTEAATSTYQDMAVEIALLPNTSRKRGRLKERIRQEK